MSEQKQLFSQEIINALKAWEVRYPQNQKKSVILPGLHVLQDHNGGYLTVQLMDNLARYLGVDNASVYEVATFYSMYDLEPVGRHKLNVCTNVSCMLNGAKEIVRYIENKLGIKAGQTTADGRVTLRTVECQGACCGAPMLEVDKVFYENLDFEKVDQLLDNLE
ncbi:NADH-quinone oxidoreductase subunit NuoE family protein [Facilibium subflavum]|uniref:NADH-quinone oxidoreductase subunit NuoE family protein n=1 Tax=Facilibium subflavum TaxID=2219058 RepID=UPI000E649B61|nr:NAD(P)H-dependent oxidoreductase subunit E [Facilibium subflavum]